MKTKICGICKKRKNVDQFHNKRKGSDKLNFACKQCMRKYQKQHYKENKEDYKQRKQIAVREKLNFIRSQKEEKACMDCGKVYPHYVLDFDHKRDKMMVVSRMRFCSIERIKREIAKCDIVCANCHRERTHGKGV